MTVELDGRPIEVEPAPGDTLQSLIDRIRADQAAECIVVSATVNGLLLIDEELSTRLAAAVDPEDEVQLESADPNRLAREALCEVAERVAAIGPMQPQVAEELNAGRNAEAIQRIGELVAVCQDCQQVITQTSSLLGRDLTAQEHDGRPIGEHMRQVVEKLGEVRDALASRDMVLLADLFHYEMPEFCNLWAGLLRELATSIEVKTVPASAS